MNKKRRVFLSYNYSDRAKVELITDKLLQHGIEVYFESDVNLSSSIQIKKNLKYIIETSETVLVIISKNFFKSEWTKYELTTFLEESHKRQITVIPVLIEKANIPSDLLNYEIINIINDFEIGIEKIIKKIRLIPEISFDNFSPLVFEELVADLLKEYDFTNIHVERSTGDQGIDLRAVCETKSPFGSIRREHWIVVTKFYKQERFSLSTINKLLEYKRRLLPADLKLLMVTNSIFTSVALEHLSNYQKIENTQIEVVDGLRLKQLISKRKRLLDKYFKS